MKYEKHQLENIHKNLERYCKPLTTIDTFKYNDGETKEHNKDMADQFVELKSEGFCLAIRPILLNGNSPDILILNMPKPMIKEVLISESIERFNSKDYMGINKIKVNGKNG